MPSYKLINEKYDDYYKYHHCFASNCDDLIQKPISLWLYGHTHTPDYNIINDIVLTCNPIGYLKENEENNWEKIVEI